jgi:hypothetical protein
MYLVKLSPGTRRRVETVAGHLARSIAPSRFVCRVRVLDRRTIRLETVRLFAAKYYCGNHPGPCRPGGPRHRRRVYLEGADWVAFNDLVNDVLDRLGVSANVGSHIAVRRGRRRRVIYDAFMPDPSLGVAIWEQIGDPSDYADHCGRRDAPPGRFPAGTPGIHSRHRAAQVRYA